MSINENLPSGPPAFPTTLWGTMLSWIPSAVVLICLSAVGWFGHHNDWKFPKISAFTSAPNSDPAPWCESHGVPEQECVNCRPDLIEESSRLTYCRTHGVHGCVLCVPTLAESKQPTAPTAADLERADRALTLVARAENLPIGSNAGSRIQFASADAIAKAGIEVAPVERQDIVETISASGEIQYDATLTAEVSPQTDGIVREVLVNVGDWVRPGDVLAVIDSQEAGRLKSALLAALLEEQLRRDEVARVERLAPAGAVAARRIIETKTLFRKATVEVEQVVRAFKNLGLDVNIDQLRDVDLDQAKTMVRNIGSAEVAATASNSNLIAVVAPLEGRIVDRSAMIGRVVDRGGEMFRIVDTRSIWLDLRVAAEQIPRVRIGQTARFLPDGLANEHTGTVSWISTDVDPRTRTVRVRADLSNIDGKLRNEMFGKGQIILREEQDAIVVPRNALQWDGSGHIVFVRDAKYFQDGRPKFFVTRSVRPGVQQDDFVELIAGVLPGEVVASSGCDVLRAQLLKSNLGAGCTCGH